MQNNLSVYHKILVKICQWVPKERITQKRNLALLITGLYLSKSVHLSKIVAKWPLPGKLPSLTNRLRRFLDNKRVNRTKYFAPLGRALLAAFGNKPMTLIIDTTQVGCHFRTLMVGLAYRKRCLPLVWSVHAGPIGNVVVNEVLVLLEQVADWLPEEAQVTLLGDAGFCSNDLLHWLVEHGWGYVIRQHKHVNIRQPDGDWFPLSQINIQPGQTVVVGWVWIAKTNPFGLTWLVVHWQVGEDDPWILASHQADERLVLRLYAKRMWIEELYGDLKGHGFYLEDTHLGSAARIENLLLGVAISFLWLISLGSWLTKRGYRHLIDRKDRRDKSYFRLGWDWLDRCLSLNIPIRTQFIPYQ
jgi:hypothetical protein